MRIPSLTDRSESWPPWQKGAAADDTTGMGRVPENRRQAVVKLLWVGMWMLYLASPVSDLADGGHTLPALIAGWFGLAVFVAAYLTLVFLRTNQEHQPPWVAYTLAGLTGLAVLLSLTLGDSWLVLFVYAAVANGAALPPVHSRWAIPGVTALLFGCGALLDAKEDLVVSLGIPCFLGGFAMLGIRQLIRTMRELREARRTIADMAATEERLRLARDLHDLLGHSLSLITLKSELAGRMLPQRPEDAAVQVADIERVSRQALVDVREAVSGYRRPTLAVELAGARTALLAAGIEADLDPAQWTGHERLAPDEEGALAWALREAVTNVVRHSGATRCAIAVTEAGSGDEVTLTVTDDGRGAGPGQGPGNGLTGLEERLLLAGGRFEASGDADGFALRASVPLLGAAAPVGGA
jgi:two-component system sensor histidine kinase DesK